MESKYYHLLLCIKPEQCRTYNRSIVISEDPLDFEDRNEKRKHTIFAEAFDIVQYREITRDQYEFHKKKNPRCRLYSRSGIANNYLMNERDYSSIDKQEG